MNDHPSSEESPQATVFPQPAPGVSHQTRSTPSTQSGSIGAYDRPESVPRSRSPVNVALLIVVLFIAIVAAGPLIAALTGASVGAVAAGLIGVLTDIGVPEEEAGYYAEGVRRGGTLVTVRAEDHLADRAVEIMERHNAVDIDQRAASWQESGWSSYNPQAKPYAAEEIARERDQYQMQSIERKVSPAAPPASQAQASRAASPKVGEDKESTIPVMEEQLQVGKRAVQRDVHIYTHVTEKPVEESVRLREEQVHVERRSVDRPASGTDLNAFKEGTIEVTATREEPVVSKQARVVEEVAVRKDAQERTETVRDTVRRTNVEIEQQGAQGPGVTDFATYETDFHTKAPGRTLRTRSATPGIQSAGARHEQRRGMLTEPSL